MSNRRPYNLPVTETGSDITIGKGGPNTANVIGVLGSPISPQTFVPNGIYVNDPNLPIVNQMTVLPVSAIPYTNDTIINYILNAIVFDPLGCLVYAPDQTIVTEY